MATGINYCQNGRLAKGLGYHLCFGYRLLAIVCEGFLLKNTLSNSPMDMAVMATFLHFENSN